MAYNRAERRVAALLDRMPGLRRVAKAGYQRLNYLLHGGRSPRLLLHPHASLARLAPVPAATDAEAFFGYFGVPPWSGDGRSFLFHRWRRGEPRIEICRADAGGSGARVVGSSAAWNFQQGSLAQWIGARADTVAFNDCIDGRLVCRTSGADGSDRVLPRPLQAVHPGGEEALSLDFRRLAGVQPEYGYAAAPRFVEAEADDAEDGLWRMDLRSGDATLLVSLAALRAHEPRSEMQYAAHALNHAVYSPGGERIVCMHRWLGGQGLFSRLLVLSRDGSSLATLLDHRMVSHYAWCDDATLLVYARAPAGGDRYYRLDVTNGALESLPDGPVGRFGDGHPAYSPDGRWFVTDTYPDRARMRRLFLCRADGGQAVEVGAFFSPWRYDGAGRCDLHPRWDREGRRVSIDSAHEGRRATYAIDVARLKGDA